MSEHKKRNLTTRVLLGMALGMVLGLAFNLSGLNKAGCFIHEYIVNGLLLVVGKMFVNALKMLVVPLVFFSLICGVCGIGDLRMLGRVGTKSFVLYVLTTAIAIATAITLAATLGIGEGLALTTDADFMAREAPPLTQVLIDIIPQNPIHAMANGDMLPIIFVSILVGVSILMVGRKAKPLVEGIEMANEVMMKMVDLIMTVAPYAVFALICKAVANLGLDLLISLAGYVVVLVGVLLLHLFITLMVLLKIFSGLSPALFIRKIRNAQVFAFSTASSNATIPVTLRTLTQRMGVSRSVAAFTVPFGATINMDGTAIMQGVATVFIANVYGIELGFGGYLTVILMAVLASIGTAGVPGVGLVMLSMVFAQVGLPIEGIGLVLGVDRLMDMVRTAVNVSGDAAVSAIVAKSEGKLDLQIYNNPDIGMLDADESIEIDATVEAEMAAALKATREQ